MDWSPEVTVLLLPCSEHSQTLDCKLHRNWAVPPSPLGYHVPGYHMITGNHPESQEHSSESKAVRSLATCLFTFLYSTSHAVQSRQLVLQIHKSTSDKTNTGWEMFNESSLELHAHHLSTQEAQTGKVGVQGQPGLLRNTPYQKNQSIRSYLAARAIDSWWILDNEG